MKRFAVLVAMAATLALAGCSKKEAPSAAAPAPGTPAAAAASVAKIPILPGYTYYAGGPVLKKDAYGKYRIAKFSGDVQQPPSRGMIFGAKFDGDKLEYRVWGNGVLLGVHRGVMRDGVYWEEYAEGYRDGKLVAREHAVNDDSIRKTKLTTEDIDPETGEVIRTKEAMMSYNPPAMKMDDDMADDEDEDTGAKAPANPAPGAPPAAAGTPKPAVPLPPGTPPAAAPPPPAAPKPVEPAPPAAPSPPPPSK